MYIYIYNQMDPGSFESAAMGIKEFLRQYKLAKPESIQSEIYGLIRIERCVDEVLKINNEGALRIQQYARRANLLEGAISNTMLEQKEGRISFLPDTNEYIRMETNNHIMNIMQSARGSECEDPNKCVRISLVFKTNEQMALCFDCKKEDIEAVRVIIENKYGRDNVSCVGSTIIIKEMTDNYLDYARKLYTLSEHPKLKRYVLTKLEIEYPKGVDVDIVKVPIDPIEWCNNPDQPISNIYFNITDNRVIYNNSGNNCVFNNSTGNTVTVQDIAKSTEIDEPDIDVDFLTWVSKNPPMRGEHKKKYYARMKESIPKFMGGMCKLNIYMDALGWRKGRATSGHFVWVKK